MINGQNYSTTIRERKKKMKETYKAGKHKKRPQSFLEEVTIIKLNPEYFENGAAYLCTPLDDPSQKFIGIFKEGDTKEIHFIATTFGGAYRKTIAAEDAPNWKIEKMVRPFTEEEIDFIISCMTQRLGSKDQMPLFISDHLKLQDSIVKKLRG